VRQIVAVFAAIAIMISSTLTASAQETPQTTLVNGINVLVGHVGGSYSSTMSAYGITTYHYLGMSYQVWQFDGTYGQCVDMTMRSDSLAPALQLFDNPGFAPIIMQDQGRGSWAEIQVMLPKSGTYYLATIAGIRGPQEGSYTLAISPCQQAPVRDPALGPDGKPWRAHY
jgi:hypothetical protein